LRDEPAATFPGGSDPEKERRPYVPESRRKSEDQCVNSFLKMVPSFVISLRRACRLVAGHHVSLMIDPTPMVSALMPVRSL